MEPEDHFRNVLPKEHYSNSSDDEDGSPSRKKLKTDSISNENSTEETYSEQYTQQTALTDTSRETAEIWETTAETGAQQDNQLVSIGTDDNNNISQSIGQNTPELHADINDSVSDDTNINTPGNLDTVQPKPRFIMSQGLLYRPSISEFTVTQKISDSEDETGNKRDMPKKTTDMAAAIEDIRQDFTRSWERILAADDLIPETELATLNSSTPDKICEYLNKLAATNARNENLKELVPKVCDEIHKLQQRDESVDGFQPFDPEPAPIPIGDFLTDPLDLIDPDHENSLANNEFEFNIQYWQRIQQAFTLPEQLPGVDELFKTNRVVIPDDARDDNAVESAPLRNVPAELAHIYSTIVREVTENQFGQSTSKPVHSKDTHSVDSDSNAVQSNCDADLYRSLLGIGSPYQRNENANNDELATHSSSDYSLARPVGTDCVPTQIFSNPVMSSPAELDSNSTKSEYVTPELDSIPSDFTTNSAELQTNPSEMTTNPTETVTNPIEMAPRPDELHTTPVDMATILQNPVELAASSVTSDSNSNQEDSDTSTPSESNESDSNAEFVVVPSKNNFKPLQIFVVNPSDAANEHNAHDVSSEESTSDDTVGLAQEVINPEEMIDIVQPGNELAMEEMNHFEDAMGTIETEIGVIIEEADRFEQQAVRFEEAAGEFREVHIFFRYISEIFENAALSLQDAVDNFESTPIEEVPEEPIEFDPRQEDLAIEDDNDPDQVVPDFEPNVD